jgi:hypothetical protein
MWKPPEVFGPDTTTAAVIDFSGDALSCFPAPASW